MHINSSITIHHSLFLQFCYFHLEMIMKASSGTTKRLASSHRADNLLLFPILSKKMNAKYYLLLNNKPTKTNFKTKLY
jgi:hypothetical protein